MSISTGEIINNNSYKHLLTISYDNIVPFVFEYIKKRTYVLSTVVFILILNIIGLVWFRFTLADQYQFKQVVLHSVIGFVLIPLLLIVPHELMHILPYYLFGARDIRIGANWRDAYFYVTADQFPVTGRQFVTIAAAPAFLITAMLVALLFFTDPLWKWSIACSVLAHLTMCAGDMALINFIVVQGDKKILTWDDTEKREAYFYQDVN